MKVLIYYRASDVLMSLSSAKIMLTVLNKAITRAYELEYKETVNLLSMPDTRYSYPRIYLGTWPCPKQKHASSSKRAWSSEETVGE